MLRLLTEDTTVRFDHCSKPEFDDWCWVDYWEPLKDVVYFKRKVYLKAMIELGAILTLDSVPVAATSYLTQEPKGIKPKKVAVPVVDKAE